MLKSERERQRGRNLSNVWMSGGAGIVPVPDRFENCVAAMSSDAPDVKPTITGSDTRSSKRPSLNQPMKT